MSGYCGFRMSNNAVESYDRGEMPKSKWTKAALIDAYNDICEDGEFIKYDLSKVRVSTLRDKLLHYTSWHHTSSRFNRTDFYEIDVIVCEELTKEDVKEMINDKPIKEEVLSKVEMWEVEYLTWGGTRAHPKATEHREIVKRDYAKNYVMTTHGRKMTYANGFLFIEKVEA